MSKAKLSAGATSSRVTETSSLPTTSSNGGTNSKPESSTKSGPRSGSGSRSKSEIKGSDTTYTRTLGTISEGKKAHTGSIPPDSVQRKQDTTTNRSESISQRDSVQNPPQDLTRPRQSGKSKVQALVARIEMAARTGMQSELKSKRKKGSEKQSEGQQSEGTTSNLANDDGGVKMAPTNRTATESNTDHGKAAGEQLAIASTTEPARESTIPATGPNAIAVGSKPTQPIPTMPIAIPRGDSQTFLQAASSAPARLDVEPASELTEWQRMERDWAEACSICFDRGCDFSLPGCQDQFCRSCLDRYLTEKIRSSWGLYTVALTCPVCYDELAEDTVRRHVNAATFALYLKNNDHRRNVGRYCPKCETRIRVSAAPPEAVKDSADKKAATLATLKTALAPAEGAYEACINAMAKYRANFLSAGDFYEQVLNALRGCADNQSSDAVVSAGDTQVLSGNEVGEKVEQISRHGTRSVYLDNLDVHERHSSGGSPAKKARVATADTAIERRKDSGIADCGSGSEDKNVSGLEMETEAMSSEGRRSNNIRDLMESLVALFASSSLRLPLQFVHIRHFPETACSNCNTDFCFQCGEASWHRGKTCEEAWREKLESFATAINEKASLSMDPLIPVGTHSTHAPPLTPAGQCKESNDMDALRWKLNNSKRCPTCHIFIQRNEGCNKVNCPHCGDEFCWRCMNSWTKGSCGFFSCGINGANEMDVDDPGSITKVNNKEEKPPNTHSETSFSEVNVTTDKDTATPVKAELGVPDIATIRFGSRGHQLTGVERY